ncbi:MAG: VCBS repeat-containing protein, partial [Blastocatellia bacterium]
MNNRGRVRYRFRFGVTLAILSILSLLTFSYVGAQSGSGIQLAVDTADTTQDGVLSIFGGVRLGGEVGLPVAAGDINGDGKADVVFCEMYATTGAGLSKNNGQVNIYVSDGRDTGTVDASQNPPSISTIAGRSAGDLLGSAVTIGDVNGDGFGDVVVSASLNDGPDGSRFNAGAVYVIPGSPNFNVHADLSAAGGATPPNGISVIYGPQMNGRFGIWVETGDVDGDGIADIVVGADQLNSGNGMRQQIGGAYIIFGAKDLPQVIDLASPPPGVRITRILGVNPGDHWGAALSVGDIDGDGLSDVMISAAIDRDSASYVTP